MSEQLNMLEGMEGTEAPGPIATAAHEAWNERAKKHGWQASNMLQGRANALRARVKDVGGIHNFIALLDKCTTSDFLCGHVHSAGRKPFKFALDWFLSPRNFGKVWDGNFFEETPAPGQGAGVRGAGTRDPNLEDRARLRNYRAGGFWPSHWGKRPEEYGSGRSEGGLLADVVLREWREVNRVAVRAPESRKESEAQRVEAMIATYDRLAVQGDKRAAARADSLRVELAELRGEKLVTFPPRQGAGETARKPAYDFDQIPEP